MLRGILALVEVGKIEMNYKKESGKRLKLAREAAGLSQPELAKKTKSLSKSRIANYEQGTRAFGQQEAVLFSKILNVSAAYLLGVEENSQLPKDEAYLIGKYRSADSRGKKLIVNIAEVAADTKPSQENSIKLISNNTNGNGNQS